MRRRPTPRGPLLSVALLAALFAAMLPLVRVIELGPWVLSSGLLAAAIVFATWLTRLLAFGAVLAPLVGLSVWTVAVTAISFADTAVLGLLPTIDTVDASIQVVRQAVTDIVEGVAPLTPTPAVAFVLTAATGLTAWLLELVVVGARCVILGAVALFALSLTATFIVPAPVEVLSFAMLAAALLLLLRAESRGRQRAAAASNPSSDGRRIGGGATAAGIAVVALTASVIVAPNITLLPGRGNSSFGVGTTIDPTLELGQDLRRPRTIEVLEMTSTARQTPYLRVATLSLFDGLEWLPDEGRADVLVDELPPVEAAEGIEVVEAVTTVQVTGLDSTYLPVSFPAVNVDGLEGEWFSRAFNRTVFSRGTSTRGQSYEVLSLTPRPTREQINSTTASGQDLTDVLTQLPIGVPAIIGDLARDVTANATTDYDKLIALQSWFRGPEFAYSLDAPVEDGFDGTGLEALAQFLTVREGYCIHFAASFAVMARELGMPSRIVVGYLPGVATGETRDDELQFVVSSDNLHAWPEVHFEGIGWVPFEPTKSLGNPTSFLSESSGSNDPIGPDGIATPIEAPLPTSSRGPDDIDAGGGSTGPAALRIDPVTLGIAALILVLVSAPGVFAAFRRSQRLTAARNRDAVAAWTYVQESAIDVGMPVPTSSTPRDFGDALVAAGAGESHVERLVDAIELASYAPPDTRARSGLGDAARAIGASLRQGASPWWRVRAMVAPRSLVVKPGSALATSRRHS